MNEASQEKSKRGNPNWVKPEAKKGKKSWKPAALNEFFNKEPGYRYRMISKEPSNLAKKKSEGWETVSAIQGSKTEYEDPQRIGDPKPLTTVQEGKDWILARIPEDDAVARAEYFWNETDRRVSGLTAHIKKETDKQGTDTHGKITISSRQGTTEVE